MLKFTSKRYIKRTEPIFLAVPRRLILEYLTNNNLKSGAMIYMFQALNRQFCSFIEGMVYSVNLRSRNHPFVNSRLNASLF